MSHETWQEQLRRGSLDLAILLTVSTGPLYGLAIIQHRQHEHVQMPLERLAPDAQPLPPPCGYLAVLYLARLGSQRASGAFENPARAFAGPARAFRNSRSV